MLRAIIRKSWTTFYKPAACKLVPTDPTIHLNIFILCLLSR